MYHYNISESTYVQFRLTRNVRELSHQARVDFTDIHLHHKNCVNCRCFVSCSRDFSMLYIYIYIDTVERESRKNESHNRARGRVSYIYHNYVYNANANCIRARVSVIMYDSSQFFFYVCCRYVKELTHAVSFISWCVDYKRFNENETNKTTISRCDRRLRSALSLIINE